MKLSVLGSAVFGASLAVSMGSASASPSPVIVTLNPSAAGLSSQGSFQASNYTLSDFASIAIDNSSNTFIESGTLQFESFKLGNTTLLSSASGLRNGTGSAAYGLYITFTASGILNPVAPGVQVGAFTGISYNFLGDPGNTNIVSSSGTLTDLGAPDVTLATGGIAPLSVGGPNQVSLIDGIPSADVLLSLVKTAAGTPFFELPLNLAFQEDSFTNTSGVVNISTTGNITTVQINGGGGNGTFSAVDVPEPASIMLLGTGLLGLGLIRRHRTS